jgi:hypothetical protein
MRRLMVAAGLLVFAVAQAGAQGGNRGEPGRGGPPGGRGGRGGPEGEHAQLCRAGADSLTDAQKQQVDQFATQFEAANKTILDSLRVLGPGRGGRGGPGGRGNAQGGGQEQLTQEQREARMAEVRKLQEALKPAHDWWMASMQSVLTKSQLEKGCVPPPPGAPPGGPGGRRGPPPGGDRR